MGMVGRATRHAYSRSRMQSSILYTLALDWKGGDTVRAGIHRLGELVWVVAEALAPPM
jgi:hypothetical protein